MKYLIGFILIFSLNANGQKAANKVRSEPPIKKGAVIEIEEYYTESDTFSVVITTEREVGPNIATRKALFKAIGLEGKVKKSDLIGAEYTLKEDLPLIAPENP
ncbi:hypothetical protein [Bdellovibrio reynosensis]|uniref:Uncharacterized protein n=1 Tax=Bdellovibrio reynosensis TaxID=2835041 RepID=A0ABY4C889_9BACT|nr:hypothetical protein [Bdellovibrio reynosensis]UOF01145.1 hypothetical protein MNR06_15710 [Bdellovibrio reynosensis]